MAKNCTGKRESLYHDACRVYEQLLKKKGSLKSLVFSQKMATNRKKAIFALIAKTIKNKEILSSVLEKSRLLIKEPKLTHSFALLILNDLLYGNGSFKIIGPATRAVSRHISKLKLIFAQVQSQIKSKEDLPLPRYVRINTLKSSLDKVLSELATLGYKPSTNEISNNEMMYSIDSLIPNLLRFSPSVNLTTTNVYKNHKIILQDRSSCLPSFVLSPPPGAAVIDACAAPGNKTSHMAAIMNNTGTIHAFDKDNHRYTAMRKNLKNVGASCVKCYNEDFLKVNPDQYQDVEYILVDPSCTGSGIIKRHNISSEEDSSDRLLSLSRFQVMILKHALSFPSVKRVVYSTCSVHKEENELVVSEALLQFKDKFKLLPILPLQWKNREGGNCIRVIPEIDLSQGFFYDPTGSSPYVLIVASNRDEYYDRATQRAMYWKEHPTILAGRDMKRPDKGTWIGISRDGKFSTVTNYRKEYNAPFVPYRSKGNLVKDYLLGHESPTEYCDRVIKNSANYDGFNFLAGDLKQNGQLAYYTNRCDGMTSAIKLRSGTYGLGNWYIDCPWKKIVEGKRKFDSVINSCCGNDTDYLTHELLDFLSDDTSYYPDPNVPNTGHPENWMVGMSSIFAKIDGVRAGTRTSTVILVDRQGNVNYTEKTMVDPIDINEPNWLTSFYTFNINNNS